jgi:CheY-like chemotaxis protein
MITKTGHFEILLADDNPEDAELVRLAPKEHGVKCTLRVISDGAETIEFLGSFDGNPKSPALDLFIVDMNLPKRSGDDILRCLRCTDNYAPTPIIAMSGLIADAMKGKVTKHAAMVFQKPLTVDGFMQLGSIVRNVLQKQARGAT